MEYSRGIDNTFIMPRSNEDNKTKDGLEESLIELNERFSKHSIENLEWGNDVSIDVDDNEPNNQEDVKTNEMVTISYD